MKKLLVLFGLLALIASPAGAQQCLPRAAMVKVLADKYDETALGYGLANAGRAVLEVFTSPTGTWTVTVTAGADRVSCILASGEARSTQPVRNTDPES